MGKSDDCVKNEHGSCKGIITETVNASPVTHMCACPCHDSTYQLVRNSIALINQGERNNPYQFTAGDDDR